MVFSSSEFLLLFLPAVLLAYYFPIKNNAYKNVILLAASLMFYAWGEPVFVFVMLFSIIINWVLALLIERNTNKRGRKALLILSLVWNVALIGVFKYLGFISENISLLLKNDALTIRIALPIGISFFTFQIISYVIDVFRRDVKAQKNPFLFALYISIFPPLIAGPIVRYSTVAEEITSRRIDPADITRGFSRFTIGLAKKLFIANYVGYIADKIFDYSASGGPISVAAAWLGAAAYALQLYHDFSGYSDMAIGLGLMFGFHFPENFNHPFAAKSVREYWTKWHITLSNWFRDYVYIPLGGNRKSPRRTYLNMLVVWLLTGLWHGANWTFIVWGLFFFCFLFLERKTEFHKRLGHFGHAYVILVVVLVHVCFRAKSLTFAFDYYLAMFGAGGAFVDDLFLMFIRNGAFPLIVGAICSLPVLPAIKAKLPAKATDILSGLSVAVLFILAIMAIQHDAYSPFIYFNF